MNIHEHTVVLMAKERMEHARRSAEQVRALRLARGCGHQRGSAWDGYPVWPLDQGKPLPATVTPISSGRRAILIPTGAYKGFQISADS
jgi:hypothetical protein